MDSLAVLVTLMLGCMCCVVAQRDCYGQQGNTTGLPSDTCSFELRMKNAKPNRADQYFCAGYDVQTDILHATDQNDLAGYIVKYEPLADAGTAHHILVFGCEVPYKQQGVWSCGKVCATGEQIIFAWAKNAPPLELKTGIGYQIGAGTKINHIVIQIHYTRELSSPDSSGIRIYTTLQRQQYLAGIFLMVAFQEQIPPNTPDFTMDVSCQFRWPDPIHPIGFRTHAHSLGSVISGYKVTDGQFDLIGKGNPQWPQAFYPVQDTSMMINNGDHLVARCVFNSTGRNRYTKIGSTSNDEMCNFYIMYYTDARSQNKPRVSTCAGNTEPYIAMEIPDDSLKTLPPNPALEDVAMGHHHHQENDPQPTIKVEPLNNEKSSPPSLANQASSSVELNHDLDLGFVSELGNLKIGQVGGLAVSKSGDVYIFHRGDIVWNSLSFEGNVYQLQRTPVSDDAILVLSPDGKLKQHFGNNSYFLPHGLTLDSNENLWLTDVGLHQVFRIPAGKTTPDMTLGIRFEPGKDDDHFCKPTDVAVLANGEFYVSDGYCNSRIIHYDANGYRLNEWGKADMSTTADGFPVPGAFNLPHGLTLAEDKGLLCVADRENGRIQCFDLKGNFVRQMHPIQFGTALYALEYCPKHGGILFAVNGPVFSSTDQVTQGFTLDINTGKLLSMWNVPGEGMNHPHDVAVDTDRHFVYVGELNPRKVWKFQMTGALVSANKTSGDTAISSPPTVSNENHPTGSKIVAKQPTSDGPSMKPLDGTVVTGVDTIFDSPDLPEKQSEESKYYVNVSQAKDIFLDMDNKIYTEKDGESKQDLFAETDNVYADDLSEYPVTQKSTDSYVQATSPIKKNRLVNIPTLENLNSDEIKTESTLKSEKSDAEVYSENIVNTIDVVSGAINAPTNQVEEQTDLDGQEAEDLSPSIIVGTLLIVPVLLLIVVTVMIRLYQTDNFWRCRKRGGKRGNKKFNLGNLLNPHKGFDRLSTEDDDHDLENMMDDSDNEEFSIVRKA